MIGKHEHARTTRRRLDEGIGVNRDEQVRLYASRLGHTLPKRNEIIIVTRKDGTHVLFRIDLGLEAPRYGKRHVFFVIAAAPDRTRIFAAMTGVERDRDHARD